MVSAQEFLQTEISNPQIDLQIQALFFWHHYRRRITEVTRSSQGPNGH